MRDLGLAGVNDGSLGRLNRGEGFFLFFDLALRVFLKRREGSLASVRGFI